MSDHREKEEVERVKDLISYAVLDTPSEEIFDQITAVAAAMCGTSIALVSFVDTDRQWFKSRVGTEANETPRSISFCSHAILKDEVMEVPDSLLDERFKDNPLVQGEPHIRFYAGAPLKTPGGHRLGTLCVIDQAPMKLTSEQRKGLAILARQVVDQLVLKKLNQELVVAKQKLEEQQKLLIKKARLQSIGEMASNIAHQINNPMAIIVGKSQVLKNLLLDGEELDRNEILKEVESIDQTAVRISEVVKALRNFSQDERDR